MIPPKIKVESYQIGIQEDIIVKKEFNRCCICFGLVWRRGYAAKKTTISSVKTKDKKTSQKAKFAITEAGQSESINY